ncbi:ABC-2 type transport system permease protein [Frankia sp. EI5c]|uniref:ABC transporter permease n=1 Tax=Frankia sp. EI5c TaxID=683316 RepID=UPI0007C3A9B2|nr:ABC transporter permease [Frankia sp. EI5c]OAA18074.1 ABC-2 type transport system permease protein [Frankia sp. EI5c]OAA19552.1 ABC-2 type transport system permease protein [Frankia sp. EI5c]
MTLLTVERIKLFSTRSPWWCMIVAVALTVGLTAIFSAATKSSQLADLTPAATQFAYNFGLVVMMVMAALAVTNEYRFGTIRSTFLAAPDRTSALLAKAAVVAGLAGIVGEITAVASWGVAKVIQPDAPLALDTAQEYRNVFGVGLIYLLAALFAVGLALLIRHTAGAIVVMLVYLLLAESLLPVIPRIGDHLQDWLPFIVGNNFIVAGQTETSDGPPVIEGLPFGPWGSLLYFAAVCAGVVALGLVSAKRRDA